MKKFILAMSLFVSLVAHSQEWVTVSAANGVDYDIQAGSVKVTENDNQVKIVVGTGRMVNTNNRTVDGELWYVPIANCQSRRGTLVSLDLTGEVKSKNTFAFGMGSVASTIAEVLCRVALSTKNTSNSTNKLNT